METKAPSYMRSENARHLCVITIKRDANTGTVRVTATGESDYRIYH